MFHVKHGAVLSVENLVAGYARRDVIDIPALSINAGKVTAVLGPNAAGKSTLARVLAGALKPRQGAVSVDGDDTYRMTARSRARRLAFMAQENTEQFAFTVRELVRLGAEANSRAAKPAKTRVEQALEALDLLQVADRDLLSLSGGERQRASLARALAQETGILILDEPTAHLDLRHQAALMTACRTAAGRGTAVLLVLHDLNLASSFADRAILLAEGRIAADGPPEKVLEPQIIQDVYQTNVYGVKDSHDNVFIHLRPAE